MIPLRKESFKIPKGMGFILLYEFNIKRSFQTLAPSESVRTKLCDRTKADIQPHSLVVPSESNNPRRERTRTRMFPIQTLESLNNGLNLW